jgi:hypothetical protein
MCGDGQTLVPFAQKRTAELPVVRKQSPIPDNRARLGNDESRSVGMRRIHESVSQRTSTSGLDSRRLDPAHIDFTNALEITQGDRGLVQLVA